MLIVHEEAFVIFVLLVIFNYKVFIFRDLKIVRLIVRELMKKFPYSSFRCVIRNIIHDNIILNLN